ncbi:MAG: hypothetical protein ACM3PS_09050, partial [Syntrophothermus sp.]
FWSDDKYRETLREQMIASQSIGVKVESNSPIDPDLEKEVSDWALETVQKKAEKMMIAQLSPVPDDQRKQPNGIENTTRDIMKTRIDSFDVVYENSKTEIYGINPQGTLPNITNLVDKTGSPIKWEDYAIEADLNNPFFKQLRVDTAVNADFEHLPIHSVEVKLVYDDVPMANLAEGQPEGEVVLSHPDDVGHFAAFINQQLDHDKQWMYKYSYQVNYKGASQIYQSPEIETNEGNLTIGVDDVGILSVDIASGDLNWSQVDSVQVTLTYEDQEMNVGPLEDSFILTKDKTTHLFQEVIFKPFRKSYKYRVKYFMKDGKEYQVAEQEGRAKNLFINDPFNGLKTVKAIAAGDLKNRIANIFLDLNYADPKNKYSQSKSVTLNANTPFSDWSFPVIDAEDGQLTYSGTAVLMDGTVRTIEMQTASGNTIVVPKPFVGFVEALVVTDLLDFAGYKLVRVSVSYEDDPNLILERKDFVFSSAKKENQAFRTGICDPTCNHYAWEATFFMNDNSQRKVGSTATTDQTIILELPTA